MTKMKTRRLRGRFALALAAALVWIPGAVHAAAMTQSDFALAVYASGGSSSGALDSSTLSGFFNPHRCLCPDTITAQLQLTSTGQTNIGSSTITVSFFLGANCSSASTSCVAVGSSLTFSASQSAASPTFDSSKVFLAAAGGSTVDCGKLTAGSTALWAVLTQDGAALPFALSLELPVVATAVAAPASVAALPSNHGLLVSWTAPANTSQIAGYQVLCLPRPAQASTAAYESCGLDSTGIGSAVMTPADLTEVCSAEVSATKTSVRLAGLTNGSSYTVAVIAIDVSGGVSALSPQATATPQPTAGFFDKYQQDGGAASGCALAPHSHRAGLLWIALLAALIVALGRTRGRHRRTRGSVARTLIFLLAFSATASAQVALDHQEADWPSQSPVSPLPQTPDWGVEIGVSLYRPAVDSEFSNGNHPFGETFGSSRHLLSEIEIDRYVYHRYGTWGVGLRGAYYKATGASFLSDGTRSGDETALRLIPFALSALYKADRIPGLKQVPLIPYVKVGLDGVTWTANSTGGGASHSGFTPGWHTAAGVALGLNFLGLRSINPGALADPCALFFEWDYAAINGLGFGKMLHVGDSTWFAGVTFDL